MMTDTAGEGGESCSDTSAFALKSKDLETLKDAVGDAAGVSIGLWLSHLLTLFYLAVAVAGVTHRDLFLANPVRLPFLNVDLPLLAFFAVGPGLFVLVHWYVLLHFLVFAAKIRVFHLELLSQVPQSDVRARLRLQLPSNLFVQAFAGPREIRAGVVGVMLRLIVRTSLVYGPIALLLFFQLQFLPFHHVATSWWHRVVVVVDLSLLWMLWPSIARGERSDGRPREQRWGAVALSTAMSVVVALLSIAVITFPGEWAERTLPSLRVIPQRANSVSGTATGPVWRRVSLHELLLEGEVDLVNRRPRSLWWNRLVLAGFEPGEGRTLNLRGRHLEGAVLIGAQLPRADFTGAWLTQADLTQADAREARFDCENGTRESSGITDEVFHVQSGLPKDDADCAHLEGAILYGTQLQGASLVKARMDAAFLVDANLTGADLTGARLTAAWMGYARLRGAIAERAEMQAADLSFADLSCASLKSADLRVAGLSGSKQGGATFDSTDLRGALLDAYAGAASFFRPAIWHASPVPSKAARVVEPRTCEPPAKACWSQEDARALTALLAARTRVAPSRSGEISRQLATRDPMAQDSDWPQHAAEWTKQQAVYTGFGYKGDREFYAAVADAWISQACRTEDGVYVIRGWILQAQRSLLPFSSGVGLPAGEIVYSKDFQGTNLPSVFLDANKCPSAEGLTKGDRLKLRAIRGPQQP